MIVITGTQRTGTSLMMRLSYEAGFAPIGDKHPQDWEETRTEKNKKLESPQNPVSTGFWEHMAFVDNGLNNINCVNTPEQLKNRTIKIFSPGIPRTDTAYIERVILCIRNWQTQVESWRKVFMFNVKKNEGIDVDKLRYPIGTEYCFRFGNIIFDWLKRRYPILLVDFDDLIKKPTENCDSIKRFIGCGRWDLAKEIIDSKHNHHRKNKKIKKDDEFKDGFFGFLDRFYQHMKAGKFPNDLVDDLKYWYEESRKQINKLNIEKKEKKKEEKEEKIDGVENKDD